MTNVVTCCTLLRYSAYFLYIWLQIELVIYRRNHLFLMLRLSLPVGIISRDLCVTVMTHTLC